MARMCGILKMALREDEPGCYLRVTAEDVAGELVQGKPIEPGLYFCSREAFDRFAPKVVERLKKTPAVGGDGRPVLGDSGAPVMTLPAGADWRSVGYKLLM